MKNCTLLLLLLLLLWRGARLQVKIYKAHQGRTSFGSWISGKVDTVVARSTCRSQMCYKNWWISDTPNSLLYPTLHYTTLYYTTIHYNTLLQYTALHYAPSHYTALDCTRLHYPILHYTNYTPLHHTPLHHAQLHYTTLTHTGNSIHRRKLQLATALHYIHYTTSTILIHI